MEIHKRTQLDFAEGGDYRGTDHRAIGAAYKGTAEHQWQYLQDFENRGGIRIHMNRDGKYGTLEMSVKPTADQKKKLRSFIGAVSGNVDVDFMDENYNTVHSVSYDGVSPARVLSGITNFYDKGINPEGNVESYSISRDGIGALKKAEATIEKWVANKTQSKSFVIQLPEWVERKVKAKLGRPIHSHRITSNSLRHILKNHGVNGLKLKPNSIPITEEDLKLIPYIMVSPTDVKRGSDDINRESVRYIKTLSNGVVVVVEKELVSSADDLETITMWAELSDVPYANNAQGHTPETKLIGRSDSAKIRKDAEDAIEKSKKVAEESHSLNRTDIEDLDAVNRVDIEQESFSLNRDEQLRDIIAEEAKKAVDQWLAEHNIAVIATDEMVDEANEELSREIDSQTTK